MENNFLADRHRGQNEPNSDLRSKMSPEVEGTVSRPRIHFNFGKNVSRKMMDFTGGSVGENILKHAS